MVELAVLLSPAQKDRMGLVRGFIEEQVKRENARLLQPPVANEMKNERPDRSDIR